MAVAVGSTTFTLDVQGRFVCDTLDEALASTRGGASPFHHVAIGGGRSSLASTSATASGGG